jgi:uncharacterized phiE125 gp8 family phage protein
VRYTVTSKPAIEPLSLADALEQCHAIAGTEDQTVEGYVSAAREWVETIKSLALITQTRRMVFSGFARSYVLLGTPIQSVSAFEYRTAAGVWSPWSPTNYVLDDLEGCLLESSTAARPGVELYEINPIRITYICGYGDTPDVVPDQVKQALRLIVGHWYGQREAAQNKGSGVESMPIPFGVAALLANF